jgi:hypothetical protein
VQACNRPQFFHLQKIKEEKMPNFKFPTPKSCKLKDRAVLCSAERILALYNQETGSKAKRIGKTVKKWFASQANDLGWAGGHFLPEVQSGHGAGCVLFVPPQKVNIKVEITKTTLVLLAESGDEK